MDTPAIPRRDPVIAMLRAHRDDFVLLGVKSLALFGSVARDDAGPESDIDLLVEFDGRPIGLLDFIGLKLRLEKLLGRKVDLVMAGAIKRQLRDRILGEAIRAA